MSEDTKSCVYCGEQILAVATKCKHCQSDLGGAAPQEMSGAAVAKPAADYGLFLLAIPVAATLLVWFWVASMNLLQSPDTSLQLIMLATVLGTAILAAVEASKLGMKTDRAKGAYGPTAWFFIIALLWIVGYPAYLAKRKHYGVSSRLLLGVVVALVYLGSWAVVSSAVESKKAEVRASLDQMQQDLQPQPSGN